MSSKYDFKIGLIFSVNNSKDTNFIKFGRKVTVASLTLHFASLDNFSISGTNNSLTNYSPRVLAKIYRLSIRDTLTSGTDSSFKRVNTVGTTKSITNYLSINSDISQIA